jgi:hypothetical protein
MGDFRTVLRDHRAAIKGMTASAAVAAALLAGATGVSAVDCASYCQGWCDQACQGHGGCDISGSNIDNNQPNGAQCGCSYNCSDGTHSS